MSDDPRPNILLITTDQQRYDTLGCNGNAFSRTPNLDAVARCGAVFHNAHIQNPVCIPSRACLFTGRYIHQHGVDYMESVIDDTPGLPDHETTFMERLQAAGYRTAAFGKIHMMPPVKGFHEAKLTGGKGARWTKSAGLPIGPGPLGRDYAAWLEERHPGGYERIYEQRRRPEYREYHTAIRNVLPLEEYVDYWTAENTVEFIRRDHAQPFFVQCGFCGPHGPIDPPEPYDALYPQTDDILPPNYRLDEDGTPRHTTPEEDAIARRFCAYYYGLVTLIDDMVGRIVAALEAKGILADTLIMFTCDHGEMLYDFGRRGKGVFYDPVVRVPLMVRPPGSSGEGKRVEDIVETFDVAATALDYARCEIPPQMSASSLRPLIEGTGEGRDLALCEYVSNDRSVRGICVRTPRYKYAHWEGDPPEQFHDLQEDPFERTDLIGDPEYRDEIERHRLLATKRLMHTAG